MNALRDIETAEEIEIRLQSNEVLVHLPQDTPLGAVPDGVFEAGFKPDRTVWLTSQGQWTSDGFLPSGWSEALAASRPTDSGEGKWELVFELKDGVWAFRSAKRIEEIPQIQDEDE